MVLIVLGIDKERFIQQKINYVCALIEMHLNALKEIEAVDEEGEYVDLVTEKLHNTYDEWRANNGK